MLPARITNVQALFLPEVSDYVAASSKEAVALCKPAAESVFVQGLRDLAKRHTLAINVGLHEPTDPPSSRVRNTTIWIDPRGDIVHRYQKLHMFDIDLRPSGGPYLQESDFVEPGDRIEPPYDASAQGLGHVGSLICFDIRFPEPAISLRRQGAQVLLYPSAFTVPTGKAHWETLVRARAIENQCYVVAAAQCGRHNEKRVSYGDSIVVAPDGKIAGRLEHVEDEEAEREAQREPDVLLVEIDLKKVDEVRKGLPLKRRDDVYGLL